MGASEGDLPQLTVDAVQQVTDNLAREEQGTVPAAPAQQTVQEVPAEYKLSGPAQAVFDKIPEGQRAAVAQYFEELDKTHQQGFTKYSQDVQGRLKYYEELGDPETLRTAVATYHTVLQDPQAIYDYLVTPKSEGGGGLTPKQAAQVADASGTDEFDDDPRMKALLTKQTQHEQLLTGIASWVQQQSEATKLAEDKQFYFDSLEAAQKKHGKIPDEDMNVIHRFVGSGGVTPEDAVAEYHRIRQSGVNEARTKPPTLLGGGATPRPPSNLNELSDEDRLKAMTAAVMEINNAQR